MKRTRNHSGGIFLFSLVLILALGHSILFISMILMNEDGYNDIISEDTPPSILDIQINTSLTDPEAGGIIRLSCNASDLFGISEVAVNIKNSNGDIAENIRLYDDGAHNDNETSDTIFANIWDTTGTPEGNYTLDFYATDINANLNYLDNATMVSLVDATSPTISLIKTKPAKGNPALGTNIVITCDVVDLSGIQSVFAFIEYPDENNIATLQLYDNGSYGDVQAGDDTYTNFWDSFGASTGMYYVDINVTDNTTANNEISINNGCTFNLTNDPFIYVSYVDASPNPTELGGIVSITCDVAHTNNVTSVNASIERPDESLVALVILYDDGLHGDGAADDDTYGNMWDSTIGSEGTYFVDVSAIDNTSSQFDLDNGDIFDLVDTTGPSISNGDLDPNSGQPGQFFIIYVDVFDLTGIASVIAYIQLPNENNIETITLYDDGAHGDGGLGDGTYANEWDSTGESYGIYYVDVIAIDSSGNSNSNELENIDNYIDLNCGCG